MADKVTLRINAWSACFAPPPLPGHPGTTEAGWEEAWRGIPSPPRDSEEPGPVRTLSTARLQVALAKLCRNTPHLLGPCPVARALPFLLQVGAMVSAVVMPEPRWGCRSGRGGTWAQEGESVLLFWAWKDPRKLKKIKQASPILQLLGRDAC